MWSRALTADCWPETASMHKCGIRSERSQYTERKICAGCGKILKSEIQPDNSCCLRTVYFVPFRKFISGSFISIHNENLLCAILLVIEQMFDGHGRMHVRKTGTGRQGILFPRATNQSSHAAGYLATTTVKYPLQTAGYLIGFTYFRAPFLRLQCGDDGDSAENVGSWGQSYGWIGSLMSAKWP